MVFVSQFFEVGGVAGADCARFEYAEHRARAVRPVGLTTLPSPTLTYPTHMPTPTWPPEQVHKLISVVMEPSVRKSDQWRGSVGMVLGSHSSGPLPDESQPGWQAGLAALHEEVLMVKGLNPITLTRARTPSLTLSLTLTLTLTLI